MDELSREEMLAQARAEMERLGAVLTEIAQVQALRADVKKEGISETAEFIAMTALIKAEEGLVDLVVAPEFGAYLSSLQTGLAEMLRPKIAAVGVLS